MTANRTAAVVGGGIIGCAVAWRLAQEGWRVSLFEKSKLGQEASWAAAGMLAPGGELDHAAEPWQIELFIQSRRGYGAFLAELQRETGVAIDYLECGAIDLAYSESEWTDLLRRTDRQKEFGIASRQLTADQVRTFSPHVETADLKGALFFPEDAVLAPRDVMKALEAACRKYGVEILEDAVVEGVDTRGACVALRERRFDAAVIAAGAWSGSLTVNGRAVLPQCEPIKGHLLGFELPLGACPTIVRHKEIYMFQRGSGMLVAGASVEHAGYSRDVDESIGSGLADRARRVLPVLEKVSPVDVWTGLRPKSDALHVERWRDTGLFLAYGHYRNGILLAPSTAAQVVQLIAGVG